MKVAIVGNKNIEGLDTLIKAIVKSKLPITELVCTDEKGITKTAKTWAEDNHIKTTQFKTNWRHKGKKAAYLRDRAMINYCNAMIVIWDGKDNPTKKKSELAEKENLIVFYFFIGD